MNILTWWKRRNETKPYCARCGGQLVLWAPPAQMVDPPRIPDAWGLYCSTDGCLATHIQLKSFKINAAPFYDR